MNKTILLGMGCFWGAEKRFWDIEGVVETAVGYAGGFIPNPSYDRVCAGGTRHAEVVKVVYNPAEVNVLDILKVFWESHNPTQGDRQGNDVGSQYRSTIYTEDKEDLAHAEATKILYQEKLEDAGFDKITTEIRILTEYYNAEEYHQKYLLKNPHGYCGLSGCNVKF